MTWTREGRRRPGRIPLDTAIARAWEADLEPGNRPIWEHGGHRFEVIERLPVPADLKGVTFLLAVPLDDGPGGLRA